MEWDSDILQMIEDCENRESKMTEWESMFIQSLSEQVSKKELSDKQRDKLEAIWDRIT